MEDQPIAILVDDAIEDQGTPPPTKTSITAIIDGCTDSDITPKSPWRQGKEG